MRSWIIVADAAQARVFCVREDHSLELLQQLKHPLSRARLHELGSAPPGRLRKGKGSKTRSSMDPRTDAHDAELKLFAAEIAELLKAARLRGEYDEVAILSPPRFLGMLRKELDPKTAACVRNFVASDLTGEDVPTLERSLVSSLDEWFAKPGYLPKKIRKHISRQKRPPANERQAVIV